jgi:uncharacterized small protein (DUF1192 family)
MIDLDIQKTIRHLKAELRKLNNTIGALEDSIEQSLAAKHDEHMKKVAQPAGSAEAIVLPVPAVFESIQLLKTHLQRMEALRSSEWNVWLQ